MELSLNLFDSQEYENFGDLLREEVTQLRAWRMRLAEVKNLQAIREEISNRANEIETRLSELELLNLFPVSDD